MARTEQEARDEYWNRERFPFFIVNHGNWDIFADATGYCAAIPTPEAHAAGCHASHFGDAAYVRATLGVKVEIPAKS